MKMNNPPITLITQISNLRNLCNLWIDSVFSVVSVSPWVNLRPIQVGRCSAMPAADGRAFQAAAVAVGWGPKRFFHSRGISSSMRSAGWVEIRVSTSRR